MDSIINCNTLNRIFIEGPLKNYVIFLGGVYHGSFKNGRNVGKLIRNLVKLIGNLVKLIRNTVNL